MSVSVIHPGGVVTRSQQEELTAMEANIIAAVASAKTAGVPQGLIVAVLHAHALIQTTKMIEDAP